MTQAPFMQLYVGDYLADTLDLTTEQHGAYLLLLMTMWRHGAHLPNDAQKLCRIARVSPRRWHMVWEHIAHFFYEDGSMIRNKRVDQEYEKATSIREKRSASGSKGGAAKALKYKDGGLANATDLPKHSQKSEVIKEEKATPSYIRAVRFDEFWNVYPHKGGAKKKRKPAFDKYTRLVSAGTPEQEIIDGAKRYGGDRRVLDGYVRDPTTWLNQAGWQDDIEPPLLKAIAGGRSNGQPSERLMFDTAHREYTRRLAAGEIQRGPDASDPFAC